VNTFGCTCGTIDTGSCIRLILGFGIKPGMTAEDGSEVPNS
jgi:hypothetical protein